MFERSWFYVSRHGYDSLYDHAGRYEQRNLSHGPRLTANRSQQDDVILQIFGTPDIRQIDGLGGGDLLTSKCAIIGPSSRRMQMLIIRLLRWHSIKRWLTAKEIVGISQPLSVPLPFTRVLCR